MRSLVKIPLALVLALGIGVVPALGGKHPVPLEPNTDPAKCIECHEDKTKGAFVHTAMSMGCTSCHEIRVIKSKDKKREDITRVKLIKATPTGQCLTCHESMKTGVGNSRVHAPVARNCLTCHDSHAGPNKNQLKKLASGEPKENLCLRCHRQGLNVPETGSRHAALDMGCDTCHVTHKTGPDDKRENRFHLSKDSPALCLDCHDVKEKQLAEAHHNQPVASADCLTCHDPHQSLKPKLAQRFLHQPFEAKACESCHAEPKDGKVVLIQADTRALCTTCHEEQAARIEKARVQHPGAQGECIACHSPHASASDRLMKPDPVTACENCHSTQAEMHKSKTVLHKAAFRDGCYTCHSGHGGELPKLLRATGNQLCLECHSPNRKPRLDAVRGQATIFGGNVRLPFDYFLRMAPLNLRGDRMGHPTAAHPVSATIDRSDPAKKRGMTCQSCHLPHASAGRALFVTETAATMPLCARCHQGMIGADQGAPPDEAAPKLDKPATPDKGKGKGKKK